MKAFKVLFAALATFTLSSGNAHATLLRVTLTDKDQSKLASELSRIDAKYKGQEVIEQSPGRQVVRRTYRFLDTTQAFYIHCSELFTDFSTVGTHGQCEVGFDYEKSQTLLESHDGFMPAFAIAEVKDSDTAKVLYKSIGLGAGPVVFFQAAESLPFTHPANGNKFMTARLRIDCKYDKNSNRTSCVVSAVK